MKVLAINGSPKKDGNTAHALNLVLEEVAAAGIETEILHLGAKPIRGCIGCGKCAEKQNERCIFDDDIVNEGIQKMKAADGIILGSPVYFAGLSGSLKSFLDRSFYVTGANGSMLRHKVGGAVAALRRSGGTPTVDAMYKFLQYQEMILPSSNYWNVGHGAAPGEMSKDAEGEQIMRVLGKNVAWVLKMMEFSKGHITPPAKSPKAWTNFVR